MTEKQVLKLREEYARQGRVGVAALRAGMCENTARKYLRAGRMPGEMEKPRTWRTREDPFQEVWPGIAARLADAPELEGKALFEDLLERHPGEYEPGQIRTFQRKVREWRAQEGPPKEIFFAQVHRAGEAMQTDFTCGNELGVTIGGEAFPHLLCHPVLPYSNWEWVTVCRSESMAAMKRGVQAACFEMGRVPVWHQTDNSTAATHDLGAKRAFNPEYLALMEHLGMTPRTIAVGKKEQNGDCESSHGVFKRRLRQHLLLRGSPDFASREAYEQWLQEACRKANRLRETRLQEELAAMRPLSVRRMAEYAVVDVRVNRYSTIQVKRNTYSVPSRLRDENVRVRVHDDRLEVYHQGKYQLAIERLLGEGKHRIDYRHVIWSLVRKPGAFAQYRYREDLFPGLSFRQAYDALASALPLRRAEMEYLQILHLAAATAESEVMAAMEICLEAGEVPRADLVKGLVVTQRPEVPDLPAPAVELGAYDALLEMEAA